MSKKRNYKTQTRVLEEFGYSSNNWRLLEKVTTHFPTEWRDTSVEYVDYRVEITHNAESGYVTQSFSVGHSEALSCMIAALTRTKERIDSLSTEEREIKCSLSGRQRPVYREIENGLKLEQVWSPEIISSQFSTETELLGYNHIDTSNGKVVRFEPARTPAQKWGSSGSSAGWHIDEIGMTVERAQTRRQELGIKSPESRSSDEMTEDSSE